MVDAEGKLVPPGQTRITYEQNFVNGEALPTWITVAQGTGGQVTHSTSNKGYYIVTSGAVSGNQAQLSTMKIPMNQYKGIMFEVRGIQMNNAYVTTLAADAVIGIANASGDASAGGRLVQLNGEATTKFTIAGSGTTYAAGYQLTTQAEAFNWRNLGILMYPDTKELIAFESNPEEPIAHCDASAVMASGLVQGTFQLTTREAVAKAFRVSSIRLTLWQD
jgi:hypothetical protein